MSIFSYFRSQTPQVSPKSANGEHSRHFCVGVPPGKQITICSTWFFVRSMITVSWEYWLCFTQFRLRWMPGFVVRSNDVLLTFVYSYQLGETAWTSTLYFLTFTEVARFEINVETLLFACVNFFINCLWYKCSVGLRTVPRSVKSKADHSRLEETVSKRKNPSYWNFINKGLQFFSKMGSWSVEGK